MHGRDLRFKIAQERLAQQTAVMTGILVTLFGVVSAALAPQVIYDYFLNNSRADQQLAAFQENPGLAMLQYIPALCYGGAALFFLIALIGNLMRARRVRMYEQELDILSYTGEDCVCGTCEDCMMRNGESMEAEAPAKKTVRKVTRTRKTKQK